MRRDYDYLIIGLGGIGSAAAYRLARRAGADVLGVEQFHIGHDRGASQDHSRIIRRSYHSLAYVKLADAAYEAWAALEADCERNLIVRTGGLDLWPPGASISMDDYTRSMEAAGVPFEILDAAETMHRWPQFRLHDATTSVYQADGGIAPAAACNAAHVALARAYGATLLENHPVTSIDARGDDISVIAGGQRFSCSKLIVAVDAWTNDMLAWLGLRIPLTVTQEQVTYFASPCSDAFALERFPIWIWMDDPSFYGFPVYGEPGPKIAQDVGGREVTPTTRTFDPDREALERVVKWLERYLPDALGPVIYTKTCLYTMPPDRDFIIDAVPDHDNVFVAVGAAHAFKFAALLGRILEDLAVGGTTAYDIEPFAVKRPALTDPEAVKSFLV